MPRKLRSDRFQISQPGLIDSEYHVDADFYVSQGEELTKSSPFFGLQEPAQGGAITSTGPRPECVLAQRSGGTPT